MSGNRKSGPRKLPCEICGKEVEIHGSKTQTSKERFLELVRTGESVRCKQCRRFVHSKGLVLRAPLGLRRKVGRRAKRRWVLESCPLGRCGATGCEPEGAVDE